ncbi:MAG: hypothetical protein GXP55_11045 [Deltaproteobacteria bacterium]|nr:hypothetical protein [Deltaproteobacteria bacterium]
MRGENRVDSPLLRGALVLCLAAALGFGCDNRRIGPITPRVSRVIDITTGSGAVADVDLLIVIDDSNSMREEQASLRAQIPLLIHGLTSPPLGDDGMPAWNAVQSLRVAVVTSDLGTSGVALRRGLAGGCGVDSVRTSGNVWGLDAALRTDPSCGAGPVASWSEGDDPEAFASSVGCLADAGTTGCGFEQPLGAASRALDRAEAGFGRPDALLAVLVLSDEEDCSLGDAEAFFGGLSDARELNTYCVDHPELLASMDELAASLRGSRDDDHFIFAAIVGIPEDLSGADPAVILADPRMTHMPDPSAATGLRPACRALNADGTSRGDATPGRRFAELATRLPGSLLWSICAESYEPAVAELTQRIGARLPGVCTSRALTPDVDGSVPCFVHMTLPAGLDCSTLPGALSLGSSDDGRALCDLPQAEGGSGWFYDTSDASCPRLSFTPDALPPLGTRVRLQCLVEVERPAEPVGG